MKIFEMIPNRIVYCTAPYCASKTMLGYLYNLRYGAPLSEDRYMDELRDKIIANEDVYKDRWKIERDFMNYPIRMCIVRDPIERFAHAYAIELNASLSKKKNIAFDQIVENMTNPDFIEENIPFVNQTRPQVFFYGKDPSIYTHVFNMNQMEEIRKLMERESNISISSLHLRKPNQDKLPKNFTSAQLARLKVKYKKDYDIYGKWI